MIAQRHIAAPQSWFARQAADVGNPAGSGLRWEAFGRGKRGGARVIYYFQVSADCIYLIHAYLKAEREDLTPQQLKVLATLMKEIADG